MKMGAGCGGILLQSILWIIARSGFDVEHFADGFVHRVDVVDCAWLAEGFTFTSEGIKHFAADMHFFAVNNTYDVVVWVDG